MKVYNSAEAMADLEALMDEAWITGYVKIRQRAGREFMLRPWEVRSPLEELEEMLDTDAILEALSDKDVQAVPMVPDSENGKAA